MIKQWARELAMGARFAASGGRSGWTRTVMTAVGVGLGVAVLLLAASVPSAISASTARDDARKTEMFGEGVPKGETTVLVDYADTRFRGDNLRGRLVRADGAIEDAARPPGVDRLPAVGEMVVSPALKRLLDSPRGALLEERFRGAEVIGVIGDEGLKGPAELAFYFGTDTLRGGGEDGAVRVSEFGVPYEAEELNALLLVLVVVMVVVLLMPIAVFIATAVRFGGESRDRRLAALRLVGADNAMARRIAAGESLFGALLGLLLGGWFFLLGRMFIGRITFIDDLSLFPSDVTPVGWIAALVLVSVPACAVAVTLLAMRGVAMSPLGVVREGTDRGRRLWWRLLALVVGAGGLGVFGPRMRSGDSVNEYTIAGSVILTLVGITALLPWVVERAVDRLNGGGLSWQLAIRRLQLNSGLAARAVSGVTIAVAGAVALQMLFSAVEAGETQSTGQDPTRADVVASERVAAGAQAREVIRRYEQTEGVSKVLGLVDAAGVQEGTKPDDGGYRESVPIVVAGCDTLTELVRIGTCRDGDVFLATDRYDAEGDAAPASLPGPGDRLDLADEGGDEAAAVASKWWTVPEGARRVDAIADPTGNKRSGVFATPAALDVAELGSAYAISMINTVPGAPDVLEHLRNTAGVGDPGTHVYPLASERTSSEFAAVRNGLLAGAIVIMLLIAASMIVNTMEQLRERKRQLSVLVAFGTRRATLGASVLWQTAVPVGLGLLLATGGGLLLGVLLLRLIERPVTDWLAFLPLVGAGLGMILLVTAASMPALWRVMRPDGLRTE
ncbi:ABC transporter permease [Streptomyces sp. 549]|uniref:FtsX-like permease family protein n=1 Tax=Streptomyces sp. 549 TaxID=3049076 RepID=UPI0024C221B2|nr:FtsX-like permease family protein [Streptomyces sp. 549]MDK1476598.1 ABC transporter permease [Streptomyces sp. 549]